MPTDLPYAADAEVSLAPEELVLRTQYEKELSQGYVSVQTKFNYSWGLVKSQRRDHQVEGVQLLLGMWLAIYRAEPARRRECLYYLALGHYKMGNLEDARKFNGVFLIRIIGDILADRRSIRTTQPQLIDKSTARDGYIGMGIAGGAAVVGALLLAGLLRRNRN
ncbi:TPR_2 domain-containing protein [Rhizoctonia solani AG-1 IA]|uniref:Mitochondrial fission 1 protein n=1 Tax=Thanatephorus cucumeris (strain AG1-IA) TaxID=983506 RepID=L8X3B2_THACA|nr:TPR_2 domain-containing protein [Rhizoctonia solani AG-1 IA]